MTAKKNWKKLLNEARAFGRSGRRYLHQQLTRLVAVFDDGDFRLEMGNIDDFKAADFMDNELDVPGMNFFQLRKMLQRFPQRAQWEDARLADMWAQIVVQDEESNRADNQQDRTRWSISRAEVEELQQQLRRALAENKKLREEIRQLKEERQPLPA